MLRAEFITLESEADLIIAFGLEPSGAETLQLIRSPQFEHILDPDQRGVRVSYTRDLSGEDHLLRSLDWIGNILRIVTTRGKYTVDISRVDTDEIAEAKRILKLMHAGQPFQSNVV